MNLSKFKLLDSNKTIYYEVDKNAIYNDQGECLSLDSIHPENYYEEAAKIHGSRKKSNKPIALRILFGHACNYSCGYCMQKDIGNPDERPKNNNLDNFIASLKDNLDLENLERIELWGGEPFLYWNDIKPVMEFLDAPNRHFFISTNGSPLREKHVDFFKNLKGSVALGISHDGPGQELLRGEEIFNKPSVAKAIQQIDSLVPKIQYSFNTVISRQNHDLFLINEFFSNIAEKLDLTNVKLSFTLGRIYDETNTQNSSDHVINGEYHKGFKKIVDDYMDACVEQLKTVGRGTRLPILKSNIFDGDQGAIKYARTMRNQIPVTVTSNCGADAEDILSLDIYGNIRLCPHTSEQYIAGPITNLKGIRIIQLDLDRKKSHCAPCNVRRLCKSSCPIKFPDEVFLQNCRNEKIWFGAVQRTALRLIFGEKVELLEIGLEEINEHTSTIIA
jgi:uncharacterized protein